MGTILDNCEVQRVRTRQALTGTPSKTSAPRYMYMSLAQNCKAMKAIISARDAIITQRYPNQSEKSPFSSKPMISPAFTPFVMPAWISAGIWYFPFLLRTPYRCWKAGKAKKPEMKAWSKPSMMRVEEKRTDQKTALGYLRIPCMRVMACSSSVARTAPLRISSELTYCSVSFSWRIMVVDGSFTSS